MMTQSDIRNIPLSAAYVNKCQFGCCKATTSDLIAAKKTGRLTAHVEERDGESVVLIRTASNQPHDQFYIVIPESAY